MSFFASFVEDMFFREDRRQYWRPHHFGLTSKRLIAKSPTDDVSILILEPKDFSEKQKSKGTILYFHPAQFNMSYNLIQVSWLADEGYTVVLFDYRGCGDSNGKISFNNIYEDSEAVYQQLLEEKPASINTNKFVIFGQGIGADAALHFYQNHSSAVCAVVLESIYATQRGWLKDKYGPAIGDFAAKVHQSHPLQPEDVIAKVSCPLLIVEPEKDDFIRGGERKKVRRIAPKHAVFWNVPQKRYLGVFSGNISNWHSKLLKFIEEAFSGKKSKK